VDTIALHVDVRSHVGVPLARQVTKVDTSVEKLLNFRRICHFLWGLHSLNSTDQ
jgi:hypothetical protein